MAVKTLENEALGSIGLEIKNQLENDYDNKIIITGRNSKPGVGKTTLAIHIARFIESYFGKEWSAEERGFIDPHQYTNAYQTEEPRSALLWDEAEHGADRRRPMKHSNVDIRQKWMKLRDRNILSIATLPSTRMLDNDLIELSDYWINVVDRGMAQPYEIYVNDFTGQVRRRPVQNAQGKEFIQFPDLEGDPDKEYMDQLKRELSEGPNEYYTRKELEKQVEQAKQEASMNTRNELIQTLCENDLISQTDLAEYLDISRVRVNQILNNSA